MTVVIILDSLLYNCPVVDSFLSLVFDWLWIRSVSLQLLFNRWLFLLIVGSKLKNSLRKWQSPPHPSRDIIVSQKSDTIRASILNIWSHSFVVCLLISSSLSIMLSCIVPLGSTSASLEFLHSLSLSLPILSKTQLHKAFSLHAGALSLWHSLPQ